jgi:multiple sugar transport system substrate-binding protein
MPQLVLSLAEQNEDSRIFLSDVLAEFDQQSQTRTELQITSWGDLWAVLRRTALSRGQMDVSEVGTTWVESLARMKALRPFTNRDIGRLGGAENYAPSIWKTATVPGDARVWAIPWRADVRVIYYWRDMLEAAGIDEETAFATAEHTEYTLERLQAAGNVAPFAAPGDHRAPVSLYQAASWIWGMGGDFASEDGDYTTFCEPAALEGIAAYFRLLLNTSQINESTKTDEVHDQFANRQLAAIMSGTWFMVALRHQNADNEMYANLGVALPPGPSFVGGSNLIVFQHIAPRLERRALALIEFLTSPEIEGEYGYLSGGLPARLDVLSEPPFSTDPYNQIFVEALQGGRSLPTISLWATVEENLFSAFNLIWERLQENPNQPAESVVQEVLEPLAVRLDRTLAQV